MTDKISKLYRKLVTTDSEYKRFRLLERMSEEESKKVLERFLEREKYNPGTLKGRDEHEYVSNVSKHEARSV